MTRENPDFRTYQLDDRYRRTSGRVFLTGTQALVRILLDQARRDRAAGIRSAGFVSGYRGSPLGGVDRELWRARALTRAHRISFLPAINEELAATAVLGAQQASLDPACTVEGVFSMWYGKGPGLDRAGDALRHGNAYGSAPRGGVLVVAGDDHGCVSSSMPHQSDVAFMAWFMPVLNPASVGEYLSFGAWGLALSRYSGCWVGFKAISETVESGASVKLGPVPDFVRPGIDLPPGGLHVRPGDLPSPEIEARIGHKLAAVEAFAEANPIDRRIYDLPDARLGIVTTGKGHLDLMEALALLGADAATCRRLGIDIYKVGMVWPLARRDALAFVRGKQEVLVVEEKRGIIESQFKEYFYDWPGDKPAKMVGKHRAAGEALIPWTGELGPRLLVPFLAERLERLFPGQGFAERARTLDAARAPVLHLPGATRRPWFCSGCPHNGSTRLPEGSRAGSGIGCHVMASWMERDTDGFAQMGGEGVTHVAASLFTDGGHIFQNLGEGTWYHSGSLAIRQAVAAGTDITYKILYNDAVAMTGGQPVDGPVSVAGIAQICRAEGVERIAVVSDAPEDFAPRDFPSGTSFHHRGDLDRLQRELRRTKGVSVLIHAQTCAAEKRRRRKRGLLEDPPRFAVINPLVCEGCGDCSLTSNCLSVEPVDTPLGRKRRINLSNCNKDFTCLDGFCPSFVTVEGARRRRREAALDLPALLAGLEPPQPPALARPFNLLVAGVGGTGVVTVGALVAMGAHLEGSGVSVLDFTGFAQKFGPVLSHLRLAASPEALNQLRIDRGAADAVIGCDAVVSASSVASAHYSPATRMVLNRARIPTGDLVLKRDARLEIDRREAMLRAAMAPGGFCAFDANRAAERLLGDAVFANVLLLGAAWQQGLVPVGAAALKQAMELNGTAVAGNARAFDLGRVLAAAPERLEEWLEERPAPPEAADRAAGPETAASAIARRARHLADYQNRAYAARYRRTLAEFRAGLTGGLAPELTEELLLLAARSLFALMALKDEYEVARLFSRTGFAAGLAEEFEPGFTLKYHLAPPLLTWGRDGRGRPRKRAFGPWMGRAMHLLAGLKGLRGSLVDPFGYSRERRAERALVGWFEAGLGALAGRIDPDNAADARVFLAAPLEFRGFGPVKAAAVARGKPQAEAALARILGRNALEPRGL